MDWPCGPMDKASDYESGDCRFESCQGHNFLTPMILLAGDKNAPPGGLEPPTFRLTAERASQLRHGGLLVKFDPQFINPCLKGPFRLMMLCTSAHVLTFQNKTEIVYI